MSKVVFIPTWAFGKFRIVPEGELYYSIEEKRFGFFWTQPKLPWYHDTNRLWPSVKDAKEHILSIINDRHSRETAEKIVYP